MTTNSKTTKKKVSPWKIKEIQERFTSRKIAQPWWLEVYHRPSGDYLQIRWGYDNSEAGRKRRVLYLGEIRAAMMALCDFYQQLPTNVQIQLNSLSKEYIQEEETIVK